MQVISDSNKAACTNKCTCQIFITAGNKAHFYLYLSLKVTATMKINVKLQPETKTECYPFGIGEHPMANASTEHMQDRIMFLPVKF